jgi:hypothetical protein
MTAQIIPFPTPIHAVAIIDDAPLPFFEALPTPANNLRAVTVVPVDVHASGATIVTASLALSAACREMATSLSLLVSHCESTEIMMADLSDGAQAIARGGETIGQAASLLGSGVPRASSALALTGKAGAHG